MKYHAEQNIYPFINSKLAGKGSVSLSFGFVPVGEDNYDAYISQSGNSWDILPTDTVMIWGTRQLILTRDNKVICFCDSSFQLHVENNQLIFDCSDENLSARSPTSRFYPYIEQIPKRGTQLIKGFRPFIDDFSEYMGVAVDRLQNDQPLKETIINTNSEDNNRPRIQPAIEEEPPEFEPQELDTLGFSIDTTQTPVTLPPQKQLDLPALENVQDDSVEYEG